MLDAVAVREPALESESFPSLFFTLTLLSLGFSSLADGTNFCVAANFLILGLFDSSLSLLSSDTLFTSSLYLSGLFCGQILLLKNFLSGAIFSTG